MRWALWYFNEITSSFKFVETRLDYYEFGRQHYWRIQKSAVPNFPKESIRQRIWPKCVKWEKRYTIRPNLIKRKLFASEISASCGWTDQGVIYLSNHVHVTFGIAFGYLNVKPVSATTCLLESRNPLHFGIEGRLFFYFCVKSWQFLWNHGSSDTAAYILFSQFQDTTQKTFHAAHAQTRFECSRVFSCYWRENWYCRRWLRECDVKNVTVVGSCWL